MEFWMGIGFGILRSGTPLLFASLAGLLTERSGVIQIALEGLMLMGALGGAIAGLYFQSAAMGFIFGAAVGMVFAGLMAFMALHLKTDQVILGTGLNILSFGLAPSLTKVLFNSTGSTPTLDLSLRFTYEPILVAAFCALAIYYIYEKTHWGLLLRFSGEKPIAVLAAGYSIVKVRWIALLGAGALAGLGGASLSLFLASSYAPMMTAGRGFMALAALILGRWKPLPTLGAVLFFASLDALPIVLQHFELNLPGQWIQALPYLLTVIAVAGIFGGSRAPKALGQRNI